MKKRVLLIIPAYNEEANILKVCKSIIKDGRYDYIVINDGSTDKTEAICKSNKLNHISLVHNLGIGGAVQTGYKYAYEKGYDIAIQLDGDGQHSVKCVEDIIEPIIKGKTNMVIGSRYIEEKSEFKSTKARQLGIKIISVVIKLVTGKKIYDTTSGFRAVDKDIIKYFSQNYPLEYPEPVSTVEVLRMKKIVSEIAVEMNEREGGISSIKAWKTIYYMINVIFSIIVTSLRRYK